MIAAGAMPPGAGAAGEPIDDRELLVRVQGGDAGAFDTLVQRYLPRARVLARRLMPDPDELIANNKTVEEVRDYIGATSLAFISHDGLVEATRRPESELCRACLTREYPTPVPIEQAKLRYEPVP